MGSKLRVIVADDHSLLLDRVRSILMSHYEVLAVPSGQDAVVAATRFDPDLAVLDVMMPDLDGFQTAAMLRAAGARCRVLFLSAHAHEDYVTKALDEGAFGFVAKPRIQSDLVDAVEHVREGRVFVPSPADMTRWRPSDRPNHGLQAYTSGESFLESATVFAGGALRDGGGVIMLATPSHLIEIKGRVSTRLPNLATMVAEGRYVDLDAVAVLAAAHRSGTFDPASVMRMVADAADAIQSRIGRDGRVSVLGETSSILCQNGRSDLALQLERECHDTLDPSIVVLCTYPGRILHDRAQNLASRLCAHHSAIVAAAV